MILIDVFLVILAVASLPAMWRIARGPTDADRAVAADLVFFVLVGVIALLAVRLDTPALLDIVVLATLTGFLATVALARLIDRSDS